MQTAGMRSLLSGVQPEQRRKDTEYGRADDRDKFNRRR